MHLQKILWGLSLLFIIPGCRNERPESPLVEVSFTCSEPQTKAAGASEADEYAISRWTVYVFDTRSGWFRYGSSDDAAPVTLQLQAGRPYACVALVNWPPDREPNPSTVLSAGDLAGKTACLEENAPGRLLMFGEDRLIPVPGTSEKNIRVRRLVARLDVRGISLDCPEWSGKTILLRHIYVTNACKTTQYGMDLTSVSSARTNWYNTLGWHGGGDASESMDALLSDRDIDAVIDATHPYTVPHTYYFYPNPVEDDVHNPSGWSPRHTRLVLEAAVDGENYYYPITLPPVSRNQICRASGIVIHGPGSPYPEGAALADGSLSIDWEVADPIILE